MLKLLPHEPRVVISTWSESSPASKSWHGLDEMPYRITENQLISMFSPLTKESLLQIEIEVQEDEPENSSDSNWKLRQMLSRVYSGLNLVSSPPRNTSNVVITRPDIVIFSKKRFSKFILEGTSTKVQIGSKPCYQECKVCGANFTTWDLVWIVPMNLVATLGQNTHDLIEILKVSGDLECEHKLFNLLFDSIDYSLIPFYYGRDFRIKRSKITTSRRLRVWIAIQDLLNVFRALALRKRRK